VISALGLALSTLPLGARFAKMLLLGKQAGVLLHAAALVAAMSEKDPFLRTGPSAHHNDGNDDDDDDEEEDDEFGNDGGEYSSQDLTNFRVAREAQHALKLKRRAELAMKRQLSMHPTSDALARLRALGAFVHAEATAQASAVAAAATTTAGAGAGAGSSNDGASRSESKSPSSLLSGSVAGRTATVLAARRSFCARLGLHEPTLVRMTKVLDQLLRLLVLRFPEDPQLPSGEALDAVKKQAMQCGCIGAQHPSPLPPLVPPSSTEEASLRQVSEIRSDRCMVSHRI